MSFQDADLNFKAKKTCDKVSENIHIVANDPSLAFYRIQEHVRKVLPPIIDKRSEVVQLQNNLQGHCYDMEYAVSAVKSIERSDDIFKNIQEMIKTSIFLKQQLKYEEVRNKSAKRDSGRNSVYKRFSAHLNMDLPEILDFSGVMRETSQRVETMMTHQRPTTSISEGHVAAQNRSQSQSQQQQSHSGGVGELQRSHTTLH